MIEVETTPRTEIVQLVEQIRTVLAERHHQRQESVTGHHLFPHRWLTPCSPPHETPFGALGGLIVGVFIMVASVLR